MRNPSSSLLDLAAGLALALSAAGCAAPAARESLTVACDFDNAPFAYVRADGEYGGRDVEMMQALAAELDVELHWVRIPFPDLLPAAERGEVDTVCATVGVTDERARRVLFTRPYFETRIAALVRAGEGEPDSLAGLAGKRVGASPGTTSELALRSRLPEAVAVLDNAAKKQADARLLEREVDAVIQDGPDADDFAAASRGRLRVLAEPVATERYAIVVAPSRAAWKPRLDAALDALERSGVLFELDARHGLR